MGQRGDGPVSTQHMGRNALLENAVDIGPCGNLAVVGDYFHLANRYSHHHFLDVRRQHKRKS